MNLESLKQSFDKLVTLSTEEWEVVTYYLHYKTYLKGDMLLRQDEVCKSISYMLKGAVIYYQLNEKGEEITTDFAFEGEWVTDNRSRISQTPSHQYIKAWEDSDVIFLQQNELESLFKKVPSMERVARLLIEQAYVKIVQISIDLQTLSAEEHYQKLVTESPQAFQRLPLYHIANYLGIAPKSLSRIRNER